MLAQFAVRGGARGTAAAAVVAAVSLFCVVEAQGGDGSEFDWSVEEADVSAEICIGGRQ